VTRTAIIDLGTNTFNLLIVDISQSKLPQIIFQTKTSVKLGEGGINKNFISEIPFQRGIDALKSYKSTIESYNVISIKAFATSAIRSARNGNDFVIAAKKQCNIDVNVISGDTEAELIYYGVRQAVKMNDDYSLIIDIGGGSTEFIIANKNKIIWKQSFLLGVARLLEKFNPSDPITNNEIGLITDYLKSELVPLFEAVGKYNVVELLGSSGSFDSLADMITAKYYSASILDGKTEYEFNLVDFDNVYKILLKSTKEERCKMKGLVEMRVDMIVVSSILVQFILSSFDIKKVRLSTYSLKEGVLYQLLNP